MALFSTLASLSPTAALNAADGTADLPSTIDQQLNLQASFTAQLRDGNGFTTGIGYLGQCRLSKSGANLLLSPYNGNGLAINGVAYAIPSAGVTLAPTGLSAGTTYHIYAWMNAGTMTLEASATTHATSTTTGMEIKSGDATRTLVGKARIITGPAFADTDAQRFVISWFNRLPIRVYSKNAGTPSTTSTSPVSLMTVAEFLAWGNHAVPASFVGSVANNTANGVCSTGLGINSSTTFSHAPTQIQAYNVSVVGPACGGTTFVPAEGYAYISCNGQVSTGTGTWQTNLEMSGVIQG